MNYKPELSIDDILNAEVTDFFKKIDKEYELHMKTLIGSMEVVDNDKVRINPATGEISVDCEYNRVEPYNPAMISEFNFISNKLTM